MNSLSQPYQKPPTHHQTVNKEQYQHRSSVLRKHLTIYISKKHIFYVKPIMITIKERLQSNLLISFKQFRTLIKYLKNDMKTFTEQQLIDFFSVLIYNYPTVDEDTYLETYHIEEFYERYPNKRPPMTLDEFMIY